MDHASCNLKPRILDSEASLCTSQSVGYASLAHSFILLLLYQARFRQGRRLTMHSGKRN